MAFLRKEKKGNSTYLRIVESYRSEDGKSKHRTLYNLGKAENYSPESLKRIGELLYKLGGGDIDELEKQQLHELARYNYGFPLVVRKLLSIYQLDTMFDRITRNKGLGFSLTDILTLLLSERLQDPVSKYASYTNQRDYLGLPKIELQWIYRSLDYLYDNQEPIKRIIYSKGRNLFNQKLDVVFYDVTTFYFDSSKEDGFREKGFGKDGKIGKTIIVFGMLIDQNKQPVGYEVYRGRQYEGHTFADALKRLQEKYDIDKVICVADTGMMNSDNIKEVESSDYEYIFGERLRNMASGIQNEILNLDKYKTLKVSDITDGQEIAIQYYVTGYKGKRLISTYSSKRAAKDKAEREEKLARAKQFIANPSSLEKKARNFYLKKDNKNSYSLDEKKIRHSERFDGFMTIATNNYDLSPEDVLSAYKQLYKIEHSFRTFKTFLETRPMFHWTEKRIMGHLALCYISFTLLNYLQLQLAKRDAPLSENKIRKALVKMQMSLITQDNKQYYLRSGTTDNAKLILKTLAIREAPDLIPQRAINQYLH
jgi:transposase